MDINSTIKEAIEETNRRARQDAIDSARELVYRITGLREQRAEIDRKIAKAQKELAELQEPVAATADDILG